VIVDVACDEVQFGQLVVSENGNYYPIDYEVNGFDLVTVEVPETPLTDITITENGVYTPSDGGYSKVTVNVSNGGELTSKIKVNSLRITDDCIVDGTWPAENIDTTHMTSFGSLFSGCTSLNNINLNGWDVRNVENANYMFSGCSSLQNIDLSGLKTDVYPIVFTTANMFKGCTSLKEFSFSKNDFILTRFWATNMSYMFYECSSLTTVDLSGVNLNYINSIDYMFYGCISLKEVDLRRWNGSRLYYISVEDFSAGSGIINYVGGKTIDEVISNNITILSGLKVGGSGIMSNYADRASLRALINGLADLSSTSSQTLSLGSTLTAKLTTEDIAVATAKNWTIA
jgi:surface protein